MIKLPLPLPRFLSASDILFGAGSVAALRALNAARALVIVSPSALADPRIEQRLRKSLGAHDSLFVTKPTGEPQLTQIQALVARASDFRPDWIVAVGGGSVIDSAKLVWALYEHPDLDLQRSLRPFALPPLRGKARFAAVPTTAGTGSEVSSAAVFLDASTGKKQFVVSHDFIADLVILDPEMTQGGSREVTASSALDVLGHAIEGYVSRFANPFMDTQAEQAVRMTLDCLPRCLAEPTNLEARLGMQMAALMAGWVQNTKVPGIGHALAHQMGVHGVPHGVAVGAFLPAAIRLNARQASVRERFDRLAKVVGCDTWDGLAHRCENAWSEWLGNRRLGDFAQGGASAVWNRREQVVEATMADPCYRANPVTIDPKDISEALERVL